VLKLWQQHRLRVMEMTANLTACDGGSVHRVGGFAASACRSEWRLITVTHNLLKLHSHQLALAAA
jgi:hypothetical protein